MPRITRGFTEDLVSVLQNGGVAILRTDTLYGIVCRADNEQAVNRIYELKHRDEAKSPIVLIADQSQLYTPPTDIMQPALDMMWPGPYSIIMPAPSAPRWIIRGNQSVAYRIPAHDDLRYLLRQTGPLIAPSANLEGDPPALTVEQAVAYFGEAVDIYADGGEVTDTKPSTLLRFADSRFEKLR